MYSARYAICNVYPCIYNKNIRCIYVRIAPIFYCFLFLEINNCMYRGRASAAVSRVVCFPFGRNKLYYILLLQQIRSSQILITFQFVDYFFAVDLDWTSSGEWSGWETEREALASWPIFRRTIQLLLFAVIKSHEYALNTWAHCTH